MEATHDRTDRWMSLRPENTAEEGSELNYDRMHKEGPPSLFIIVVKATQHTILYKKVPITEREGC